MPEVKRAARHNPGPLLMTSQQQSTLSRSCCMASTMRLRLTQLRTRFTLNPHSKSKRPSSRSPWPMLNPSLMLKMRPLSGQDLRVVSTSISSSGIHWAIRKTSVKRNYPAWQMWKVLLDKKFPFSSENFFQAWSTCLRSPMRQICSGIDVGLIHKWRQIVCCCCCCGKSCVFVSLENIKEI